MNYIIIEMQTNDGPTAVLTEQKSDWNEACSVYFLKLSYAAVSNVKCHSVSLLSEDGEKLLSQSFEHNP